MHLKFHKAMKNQLKPKSDLRKIPEAKESTVLRTNDVTKSRRVKIARMKVGNSNILRERFRKILPKGQEKTGDEDKSKRVTCETPPVSSSVVSSTNAADLTVTNSFRTVKQNLGSVGYCQEFDTEAPSSQQLSSTENVAPSCTTSQPDHSVVTILNPACQQPVSTPLIVQDACQQISLTETNTASQNQQSGLITLLSPTNLQPVNNPLVLQDPTATLTWCLSSNTVFLPNQMPLTLCVSNSTPIQPSTSIEPIQEVTSGSNVNMEGSNDSSSENNLVIAEPSSDDSDCIIVEEPKQPKIFVKKLCDLIDKPKKKNRKSNAPQPPFKCPDCPVVCIRARSWRKHRKLHRCLVCCLFETCKLALLRDHYLRDHQQYYCCATLFKDREEYVEHTNQRHHCNSCMRSFINLTQHKGACKGGKVVKKRVKK